jgi:hypothetical protein
MPVNQPTDLRLMVEHPMPTRDHAALLASYHLLAEHTDACLHVQVCPTTPTSFFESWEITRAAFMARMSSTLRHLGYLAPSYSRLDGVALARTLVDHAITFAWISGDPKKRLPTFLRASFSSQLDKHKAARKRGVQLIDEQPRKLFQAYVRTVKQDLPGLLRRSDEADASWREQIATALPESLQIADFRGLYDEIYDHYSAFDHPSTLGLQVFVHLSESPVLAAVDGRPERDRIEDLRPYWIATFAFAEALVVSNLASGHPRLRPLQQTLQTIGTLRNLDREGRLAVTETADGITLGIADPDETAQPPA